MGLKPARIIGHRGMAGLAKENTVDSFRVASRYTNWVEADVLLTQDDQCVICHDDHLGALYGLDMRVRESTLEQLQQCLGVECLLTLEQLLTLLDELKLNLNLEVKVNADAFHQGQVVAQALKHTPFAGQLILSSFHFQSLIPLSDYPLALLLDETPLQGQPPTTAVLNALKPTLDGYLQQFNPIGLHLDEVLVTSENAVFWSNLTSYLGCYTVNDAQRAQQLFALGCHSVFTDRADRLPSLEP